MLNLMKSIVVLIAVSFTVVSFAAEVSGDIGYVSSGEKGVLR